MTNPTIRSRAILLFRPRNCMGTPMNFIESFIRNHSFIAPTEASTQNHSFIAPTEFQVSADLVIEENFWVHTKILSGSTHYFKCALSSTWARFENDIFIFKRPNITPQVFSHYIRV
ncbi:9929_t:CDS:2 [Gigaspora margarita]|uniref:9929_t:CDS:1 n=1 Tax=Gigaspora margarita TaxID=4874 RepID=A0ABN7V7R2_GIGMA|nr:9929_t:CDS:2 [Gigaspora margarita]